jgi:pyruvate/2-oxoglutarate/acetoin dehydrogenase E1 component
MKPALPGIDRGDDRPGGGAVGADIEVFGGAYRVTEVWRPMSQRVRDTPISEAAMIGAAIGAA